MSNPTIKKSRIEQWTAIILGTFFGIGYFPVGPGTLASAVTVALFLFFWPAGFSPLWLLVGAAALLVPSVWAATICVDCYGSNDPGRVVIDEVIGQMATLAAVPALAADMSWKYALLSFILFRTFDIVKPYPVRSMERLPSGWGVIVDDCGAAAYAFALVRAAVWLGR